jgi:hypothetical protein
VVSGAKVSARQPIALLREEPLGLDQRFMWEEYTFRLAPMSGHTRFSAAISFEADGKRFAHTGDRFFFERSDGAIARDDWQNAIMMQNHVYRNDAFLDSFRESAAILRAWRPDIVITGHREPMHTDEAFFRLLEKLG